MEKRLHSPGAVAWPTSLWLMLVLMVLIVVSSNVLVQYPIPWAGLAHWLTWGAATYPLSYLVTDWTNRTLGLVAARRVVWAGFAVAVIISESLADARIAFASGTAFLLSQFLDVSIFDRLRQRAWWRAPLISSVLGSALDTAVFFSLAFAGTQVPWVTLAIGDYAFKVLLALLLLLPYRLGLSLRTAVPG